MDLDRIPLWTERRDISVEALWRAYSQFLYLPRLANQAVLAAAISTGVNDISWESETFAYADGHDGDKWVGLRFGQLVDVRPGGLVVASDVAQAQINASGGTEPGPGTTGTGTTGGGPGSGTGPGPIEPPIVDPPSAGPTRYYGQFNLDPVRAIRQLEDLLANVVNQLARAEGAETSITIEINSTSDGFNEAVRRTVTENANQLRVNAQEFEK